MIHGHAFLVFTKLQRMGQLVGMKCTVRFNMGIGMILIVDADDVDTVKLILKAEMKQYMKLVVSLQAKALLS